MKKSLLLVTIILSSISSFAQDQEGGISLNIYYKGDSIRFKRTPISSKLKSEDKNFILKDLSEQFNDIYNYDFLKYPKKRLLYNSNWHLQIKNKRTKELMEIIIANIPHQREYYLAIPFLKGRYVLTVLPTDETPEDPGLLDETYVMLRPNNKQLGYDITPADWRKHRIKKNQLIEDINLIDYLIKKKTEKIETTKEKKFFELERLVYIRENEKIIIDEGKFTYIKSEFLHYQEFYYQQCIGKIELLKDSMYISEFDSCHIFVSQLDEGPIEGHEPATQIYSMNQIIFHKDLFEIFDSALIYNNREPDFPIGYLKIKPKEDINNQSQINLNLDSLIILYPNRIRMGNISIKLNYINMISNDKLLIPISGRHNYVFYINPYPRSLGIYINEKEIRTGDGKIYTRSYED